MLKSLVLVGGLAAAAVAGISVAQTHAAGPGAAAPGIGARLFETPLGKMVMGRIGRAMVLRSELDVTPEQRQKIRSIVKTHREQIAAAVKPVLLQRRKLRDAVLADQPNENEIRASSEALGKSIGDAAVALSGIAGEVREVMTDEQLKKIAQFRSDNSAAVGGFFQKVLAE